mmetsp:Transcript_159232/g.305490  ORF Transcript_159232/g.305490 Transcript_159232/m.305490 type:complete len:425 (+) Transcript_159232:87-1361(+)
MCGGDPTQGDYTTPECLRPVDKSVAVAGDLIVEELPITLDGYTYPYGRIAYIKGRPPAPVILVHHNYCGMKKFDVDQACFLAKAGYVGVCTDLYTETETFSYTDRWRNYGKLISFEEFCEVVKTESIVEPHMAQGRKPLAEQSREELQETWAAMYPDASGCVDWYHSRHRVGSFTQMNDLLRAPDKWRRLMAAYLDAAFAHSAVKAGKAGAIGYCLGGQSCLEQLRAGHQIQAICSFHGLLHSRPTTFEDPWNSLKRISTEEYNEKYAIPNNYNKGCRVLIENGAYDIEVPMDTMMDFVKEMDEQEIDWRFDNHARTLHGFALAKGVPGGNDYTELADRRSSIAMLSLFAETWPEYEQYPVECNACGTKLGQYIVTSGGKRTLVRALSSQRLQTPSKKSSLPAILAAAAAGMAVGVLLSMKSKL